MNSAVTLCSLLRMVLGFDEKATPVQTVLTPQMLEQVYALAQKHDLAHLAAQALEKLDVPDCPILKQFRRAKKNAVFRYIRQDDAYSQICNALEEAQIPFLPLKGAVMRAYYPEAWMRTSCDIDILVQEDRLDTAAALLEEKLRYERKAKGNHDLTMTSENGIHLELHYLAIDKGQYMAVQNLFGNIWEVAEPKAPFRFQYVMPDEWFYLYHVAHMAKHFENGGCGIRPFLDLWILNYGIPFSRKKRDLLLEKGELLPFGQAAEKLAQVWFSNGEANPVTEKMAEYIIRGGIYGNQKNLIGIQQTKTGGRLRYAIRKIFLPYEVIRNHYPILKKYRILTPAFEVVRWLKLMFRGGFRRSLKELRVNGAISTAERSELELLLQELQLRR